MSPYSTCCIEQKSIKKQNRLLCHQSCEETLEKAEAKARNKKLQDRKRRAKGKQRDKVLSSCQSLSVPKLMFQE